MVYIKSFLHYDGVQVDPNVPSKLSWIGIGDAKSWSTRESKGMKKSND